MKSSIALAALIVAAIGFGAALPATADDASSVAPPPPAAAAPADPAAGPQHMRHPRAGRVGMFLALACSDKGSEILGRALDRLDHRLDLTTTQQPLFDAFRTKALSSETAFAQSCKAAKPDDAASATPDLLAQVKARLVVDTARITALNDVLPDFSAFYATLTDAQKADLAPHHGHGHKDANAGGAAAPADANRT